MLWNWPFFTIDKRECNVNPLIVNNINSDSSSDNSSDNSSDSNSDSNSDEDEDNYNNNKKDNVIFEISDDDSEKTANSNYYFPYKINGFMVYSKTGVKNVEKFYTWLNDTTNVSKNTQSEPLNTTINNQQNDIPINNTKIRFYNFNKNAFNEAHPLICNGAIRGGVDDCISVCVNVCISVTCLVCVICIIIIIKIKTGWRCKTYT